VKSRYPVRSLGKMAIEHEMNRMDPATIPTLTVKLSTWVGFTAMCIGMFMAILDIQVVVTALPVIQEALDIGADNMSWIQTAYLIAEVIAIPLTGLLTRVFSMRWLFAGALVCFVLASIGCAISTGAWDLIAWRIMQGFAGGVLIPLVFSAIFLMFNRGLQQTVATTIGGFLAVSAPALGPIIGGWLTEHYSWHWLFLINVVPGICAVICGIIFLPRASRQFNLLRTLDWISLFYVALALAAFLIALKEAPENNWVSWPVMGLFVVTGILAFLVYLRPNPAIMFHLLKDRNLAYGCVLSFLLGACLFGSVYLMPVFLAFVRGHSPLQIGLIILVTGVAQLIAAPLIVQVDRFFNARLLSAIGFSGFAMGLAMSWNQTVNTDYNEMFWPQVVRGAFIALCILPPIRFALGLFQREKVADASGLFNLSRNLGGAIGIALIDTVLFSRAPVHADAILEALRNNDVAIAGVLGLTPTELPNMEDPSELMGIMDTIQGASLTLAVNECWMMLSGIGLLALPVLFLLGPIRAAQAPGSLAKSPA
jgi:MFS transporter, DHA2 family, multidrug resistance protein